jgi:hypothetical protein
VLIAFWRASRMTSVAKPAMKTAAIRPMMMYVLLDPPPDESTRRTCAPLLLPKLYAFCSPASTHTVAPVARNANRLLRLKRTGL